MFVVPVKCVWSVIGSESLPPLLSGLVSIVQGARKSAPTRRSGRINRAHNALHSDGVTCRKSTVQQQRHRATSQLSAVGRRRQLRDSAGGAGTAAWRQCVGVGITNSHSVWHCRPLVVRLPTHTVAPRLTILYVSYWIWLVAHLSRCYLQNIRKNTAQKYCFCVCFILHSTIS